MQAQLVNYEPQFEEKRELYEFLHAYLCSNRENDVAAAQKKNTFSVRLMKLGANLFPA